MMYSRLYLARNLLRDDDGLLWVSISDDEAHNLRHLLDEIFGPENFIGCVVWNSTKSVTNTALISVSHTYNYVYARSKEYFVAKRHHFRLPEDGEGFTNPDNDPRGPWKADPFQVGGERPNQLYEIVNPKTGRTYRPNPGCSWKNDHDTFQRLVADNRIVFGVSGEAGPQRKRFLNEAEERGKVTKTLWDDVDTTTNATRMLKEIFGESVFDNPKPIDLVQRFIQLSTHDPKGAIVLDFFGGSGTTAHAVLSQNLDDGGTRKFIIVQLPEPTERTDFPTIADICKERIRRVIKKLNDDNTGKFDMGNNAKPDLGFKSFKLTSSNFKIWDGAGEPTPEELRKQLGLFADHLLPERTERDVLYELMLKRGLSMTAAIEEKTVANHKVYSIADGLLAVCLANPITQECLRGIIGLEPQQLICLDAAFVGNDQLKTNTVLEMKSHGIKFLTV